MISSSRTLAIACVTVSLALVAGCSGHKSKNNATPTLTPTTTSTSPSASTSAPAAVVNPFTGLAYVSNSVVAVKIDDTGNGRPQRGINQADVVYVEEVEGGLTRLLAIFNTTLPTVEPVRSTRTNDPELLAEYGPIAFVASGGAPHPLSVLDHSPLRSTINDRGGPSFVRDSNRSAPYNLISNLAVAAKAVRGGPAKSIGLTFASATNPLLSGTMALTVRTQVGQTPIRFDWNASLKRYVRVIDGVVQHDSDGKPISTRNVIVQFCTVSPYPADVDVNGNPAAYTHSIGRGRAVIFSNGHMVAGRWTRLTATSGTDFTTVGGTPIPLLPGGEWVILVPTNAPLSS